MGRRIYYLLLILLALRLCAAYVWEQQARRQASTLLGGDERVVEALVQDLRAFGDGRWLCRLNLAGPLRAALLLEGASSPPFQIGDYLSGSFRFSLPEAARNPGAFDERRFFLGEGLHVRARLSQPESLPLRLERRAYALYPKRWAAALRADIGRRLRLALGEEEGALAAALLLGETRDLSEASKEDFRRAGLTHLLVVSSGNVAVWLFLTAGPCARFLRRFCLRQLILCLLALVFACLSGWDVAVSRAVLMFALGALAAVLRRPLSPVRALLYSAFLLLLWNERCLFQPGFWMSFGVTLALLLFARRVQRSLMKAVAALLARITPAARLERHLRLLQGPVSALAMVWVAQCAVLPFYAYFRSVWGLPQLVVNWAAAFLMFFLLTAAFLFLPWLFLPAWLSALGSFFALPLSSALRLLSALARFGAAAPGLFLMNWERLLFFLPLYLWLGLKFLKKQRVLGLSCGFWLGATLLPLCVFSLFRPFTPEFRASFLDVGQGACVLIQDRYAHSILFDCGPASAWGVLRNALDHYALSACDLLVLSHMHEDHCGALKSLLEQRPPKALLFPPDPPTTNGPHSAVQARAERAYAQLKAELRELCREKGVVVYEARRGSHITLGALTARVLHSAYEGGTLGNAGSYVLAFDTAGGALGLCGDVAGEDWARLSRSGELDGLIAFQCPHHGAGDALPALQADVCWLGRAAVAQLGRRNLYGHPHAAVLKSLKEAGIPLFRSDRDGCVELVLRAGRWSLRSFLTGDRRYLLQN